MPSFRAFKKTGGMHYDPEEVKKYEVFILKELDYKLDYLTSYDIIRFIINYGLIIEEKFFKEYSQFMKEFLKEYFTLALFFLEELISEINVIKFTQLQMACACLMMASFFKFHFIEIDKLLFEKLNFNPDDIYHAFSEIKL